MHCKINIFFNNVQYRQSIFQEVELRIPKSNRYQKNIDIRLQTLLRTLIEIYFQVARSIPVKQIGFARIFLLPEASMSTNLVQDSEMIFGHRYEASI